MLKYLSPSSIGRFEADPEDFYCHYMTDRPRFAQTDAMAAGSAFDAFVKFELSKGCGGESLDEIMQAQVEPQHLPQAYAWGEYLLGEYKRSRAFDDLKIELSTFGKFSLVSDITTEVNGVPLRGKPDLICDHFVLDWKVNGFHSRYSKSPEKGFVRIRGGKHGGESHKMVVPILHQGVLISNYNLEDVHVDWARQMAIYGWLAGFEIGDDFIVGIDQLVCKPRTGDFPHVRVAEHRALLGSEYQKRLFDRVQEIWEIIHSDHFFRDMSKQASQDREATLKRRLETDPMLEELLR